MIFGIGTDIIKISRIQAALERHPHRFVKRILGTDEQLANLPLECIQRNVQQLGLPSTIANLRACVSSVHTFQLGMANSRAERDVLEEATENVKYIMGISRELNGERDIPKLLNLILLKAREICKADAGSIYTIEHSSSAQKMADAKLRWGTQWIYRMQHTQTL